MLAVYLAIILFKHPWGWGRRFGHGSSFLQVAIGREEHTSTLNSAARNRKELPIPAAFLPTQMLPLPLQPCDGRSPDPFLCALRFPH